MSRRVNGATNLPVNFANLSLDQQEELLQRMLSQRDNACRQLLERCQYTQPQRRLLLSREEGHRLLQPYAAPAIASVQILRLFHAVHDVHLQQLTGNSAFRRKLHDAVNHGLETARSVGSNKFYCPAGLRILLISTVSYILMKNSAFSTELIIKNPGILRAIFFPLHTCKDEHVQTIWMSYIPYLEQRTTQTGGQVDDSTTKFQPCFRAANLLRLLSTSSALSPQWVLSTNIHRDLLAIGGGSDYVTHENMSLLIERLLTYTETDPQAILCGKGREALPKLALEPDTIVQALNAVKRVGEKATLDDHDVRGVKAVTFLMWVAKLEYEPLADVSNFKASTSMNLSPPPPLDTIKLSLPVLTIVVQEELATQFLWKPTKRLLHQYRQVCALPPPHATRHAPARLGDLSTNTDQQTAIRRTISNTFIVTALRLMTVAARCLSGHRLLPEQETPPFSMMARWIELVLEIFDPTPSNPDCPSGPLLQPMVLTTAAQFNIDLAKNGNKIWIEWLLIEFKLIDRLLVLHKYLESSIEKGKEHIAPMRRGQLLAPDLEFLRRFDNYVNAKSCVTGCIDACIESMHFVSVVFENQGRIALDPLTRERIKLVTANQERLNKVQEKCQRDIAAEKHHGLGNSLDLMDGMASGSTTKP